MSRASKSRVKMADVARAVGVSAMTVSRALRRDASIAPATRQRIQDAVQKLGYVPDRNAGSFSSQRSGFVAVLVPSLNNPHFAETASGLQDVLSPSGLELLLGHTGYRADQAERLIETMLARRPEAVIVTFDDYTEKARRLLADAGVPIIEIWERPKSPIGHVVGFSNRASAQAMAQHLIALGRKKIAYIGEAGDAGTRGAERRKGFGDAMKAAGLEGSRQIATDAPPINMEQGRAAMKALLAMWPDTDAVMCVSDPAAFGALTYCQSTGRRVPEDIAIAGFGDFEISRCALPAISTVVINGSDIGRRAGELVLELLSGAADNAQKGSRTARRNITVPATVAIRASTSSSKTR
jgi:LacI family transcriptional regulator, gluconate utilization system Gnt-I transcriptional repressor